MKLFLAIIVVASTAVSALAQTPEDAFTRGNNLYRAEKFSEAAKEYETVLKQGLASAELYYNLGNAYYRVGNTAQAVLAYERALRLRPNDADIKHNLQLANLRITDRIDSVPELFLIQWLRTVATVMPIGTTVTMFTACWVLFFGALVVMFVMMNVNVVRLTRWVMVGSGVFVVVVGVLLGLQIWQRGAGDFAIVTAQVATAKSSPDNQSVDAFVVHEGLKVRIGDRLSDWVKITLSDGKVGWVKTDQCEQI